jgi:hypothetical protein
VSFDYFCFRMFVVSMFVFRVIVGHMLGITESGSVFGAFVGGVGFKFGAIRGAVLFDFLGFFFGEFRFGGRLVFGSIKMRFLLTLFFFGFFVFCKLGFASGVNFLRLVFLEIGAAGKGIGLGVVGSFFVLCLSQLGSEGDGLFFA